MSADSTQRSCLRSTFPSPSISHQAMPPPSVIPNANGRTLKRSYTAVAISTPPSPSRTTVSNTAEIQARKSRHCVNGDLTQASVLKGKRHHLIRMPSAAGPRMYENHIPSFMSVYDMDSTMTESPSLSSPPKLSGTSYLGQQPQRPQENEDSTLTQIHSHQHRESTSTQASDSTDSSPTTTISTVDSSSLSDPSPSSSPESPITLVPLSSFSGSTFGLDSFQSLKMVDSNPPRLPLNDERPMTSPGPRKPKNPKSLALNLSPSVESFQASEPSSPSFIKPPTLKGRRKPSLLSLNTGAANSLSLSVEPIASPGMPTMLQRRGLKHSISSPQMLITPGFGPKGGMTFGTLGERKPLPSRFKESNLAMNTFTIDEDSQEPPTGVQMATRVPGVAVGGDTFDRPHSGEDAKSPSYPEGPILMHEPSVHLYLEPKIEEAMQFDVVINVAREVKNPFKEMEIQEAKEVPASTSSNPTNITPDPSDIPPDTAATMMSFKTAFEVQPSGSTESSPTTPKPVAEKKVPEYIHIPWDHNTDVKDELWDLCQIIEARTKEGKKVLVHCQQGASRSATLIIAYGMYINQDLGPNEAYSMAQAKSRWVNPNMSLLFSLNDFKKVIERKKAEKNNTARSPPMKHRPTLSADTLDPPTPSRARGNSTPSASARDNALAKPEKNLEASSVPDSAISRLGGFDFGFGDMSISHDRPKRESDWEALLSPRISEMTNNPIQNFSRSFVSTADASPTPNLFSPRAFEFPRSSFFPLPHAQRMSLAVDEDPRSPPTKGEAPITRSIDDFL
jgi:tyrosine-protein phosphatase